MFRFTLVGDEDGFNAQLDRMGRNLARAITIAVDGAANGLKEDLRRQLRSAGNFRRFAFAIRTSTYPNPRRSYSPDAVGTVWAAGKTIRADGLATVGEIFDAFSNGVVVGPKNAKSLAIPLHEFRGANGRRLGPNSSFFRGRLFYVPSKSNNKVIGILATKSERNVRRSKLNNMRTSIGKSVGKDLVAQFLLVKSARIPKLMTPDTLAERWANQIPSLIESALVMIEKR